jgi:hypothetical protein
LLVLDGGVIPEELLFSGGELTGRAVQLFDERRDLPFAGGA